MLFLAVLIPVLMLAAGVLMIIFGFVKHVPPVSGLGMALSGMALLLLAAEYAYFYGAMPL